MSVFEGPPRPSSSKKHSSLSAVVVRFIRTRGRYERQGLLVTAEAIDRAEEECIADAAEREARRQVRSAQVAIEDRQFAAEVAAAILQLCPGCPAAEAEAIARHTTRRGSGRVGRSAAAKEFDPGALKLAVMARIRHVHTGYDTLLMRGLSREDARSQVRDKVDRVLEAWSCGAIPAQESGETSSQPSDGKTFLP